VGGLVFEAAIKSFSTVYASASVVGCNPAAAISFVN
jgi:hypothetical protein